MALTITHNFVSPVVDLNEPGIVGPNEWNESHDISGTLPSSQGGARSVRTVTSGATVTVDADTDDIIYIKKTVGSATTVNLPAAGDRDTWRPIKIVDGKGDADTNNITIAVTGAETIAALLSSYIINFAGGSVDLWPNPDGTGWYF